MAKNMFVNMQNQAREDVVNSKRGVNPERSVFPYGIGKITTLNEGALVPVDCFFCLPGDSIDIDWTSFLESLNPFVDRMYSGMKLSIHAYFNKCEHEWKGWKNFATRGRRGNITSSLPKVDIRYTSCSLLLDGHFINRGGNVEVDAWFDVPFGLANHLTGVLNTHFPNQPRSSSIDTAFTSLADAYGLGDNTQVNRSFRISGESGTTFSQGFLFNAIPFAMYQRIYRDFYLNQNLCKDNDRWFPDDDEEFCLPYHALSTVVSLNAVSYTDNQFSLVPNNYKYVGLSSSDFTTKSGDAPILLALRYRQWSGDVFTTSVPFLERNGVTNLFSRIQSITLGDNASGIHQFNDFGVRLTNYGSPLPVQTYQPATALGNNQYGSSGLISVDSNTGDIANMFSVLSFNELQELAASTLWSRRNADAKGDYNSLIRAHYGVDPDSEDRSPRYLGGSIQRLEFNSVVSSVETSLSPLGTKASIVSSGGRGSSTHFECPDFGYVMIIASLVPDTFYTQGLRPEFDPLLRGSELPWPEFANLQKQNLLLQRLYYSGISSQDSRLIGYTERFIDYKYRDNRLGGHFNDYLDSKFRSMSFARYFDSSVMANFQSIDNEFVTLSPYNCRSDMYSVPSQPHFVLQFGDNVRLVRCLPYASKEATLTNIA